MGWMTDVEGGQLGLAETSTKNPRKLTCHLKTGQFSKGSRIVFQSHDISGDPWLSKFSGLHPWCSNVAEVGNHVGSSSWKFIVVPNLIWKLFLYYRLTSYCSKYIHVVYIYICVCVWQGSILAVWSAIMNTMCISFECLFICLLCCFSFESCFDWIWKTSAKKFLNLDLRLHAGFPKFNT